MKLIINIAYALLIALLLTGCKKEKPSQADNLFKFKEYISYHTKGHQSIAEPVRIELSKTVVQFELTQEIPANYIDISPAIKGRLILEEGKSLIFFPNQNLKPDTEYQVTLNLSKIFEDVPKDLRQFSFYFKTITPDFKINLGNLQSYDKDWQHLSATIEASDVLDSLAVRNILNVSQKNNTPKLKWDKEVTSGRLYHVVIDSIRRFEEDSKLQISWDGSAVNSATSGDETYTIPGKNNFTVVDIKTYKTPQTSVQINFSDPLQENQNFDGLIAIENSEDLRFEAHGNVLTIYPSNRIVGNVTLEAFQGITNVEGYKLKKGFAETISFEQLNPATRLVSKGVILPQSHSTPFYFEAVNLKYVDVRIIQIFENNVLQYLQSANLNDRSIYNLNRVGRRIAKKTVTLQEKGMHDDGQWKTYAINLAEYFKADPGSLYRVEISFEQEYALYDCSDSTIETDEQQDNYDAYNNTVSDNEEEREEQYWDNRIYRWRTFSYNWQQRDNPCHPAYYNEDRILNANVLGSDLGLIVKKGENQSYHFAATNLINASPENQVKIGLYNYQQQKIAEVVTNTNGFATADLFKEAAFAVARKNNQYAYVKLDDGNALSLSNFDISGKKLQKGLKGFIYTERGVHRPGDTIHLTFALNDLTNPLPENHPVTLEVKDARGKLVQRDVISAKTSSPTGSLTSKSSVEGFFYFPIATAREAPTGNWNATISVGGAQFSKTLPVATVKPNRLKIQLDFDSDIIAAKPPSEEIWLRGTAQANWLHGAPARNLGIEMNATIRSSNTPFKGYQKYVFHDPVRHFEEMKIDILKSNLNENGVTTIQKKIELNKNAPGMLRAGFLTKVFEGGGDFSMDVFSKDIAPFSHFVGLQSPESKAYGSYHTDEAVNFNVVSLNAKGTPAPKRSLQVKVFKIEWRWWWNQSQDNLSRYENATVHQPVQEFDITTDSAGKASFNLNIPDEENGRYLIRVIDTESGHATGRVAYFYKNWWSQGQDNNAESAKMLVFSADKEKYQVGETAQISFPSMNEGMALLSIENGTEVLETQWIKTQKGETIAPIAISEFMAPNVYVNISLLQPHHHTKNDLPIRLYGVVPLLVENPETVLEPEIEMPDVLKPETKYSIRVSEKNNKPMTYTLAIVDEGLLDITRFHTPDIHSAFYSREALGVKTFDIYDDVIGAYSGSVENIYTIGGGDEAAGAKNRKADRFKPVVNYLGPFTLQAGQKETHTLHMPNYIGSVRTMIVAGDNNKAAYGSADKTTPVRKPLMVLASVPRKLSPGETVTIPITVFAMEENIKNVEINVLASEGLKPVNGTKKNIKFSSVGEQIVNVEFEVLPTTDVQTIEVIATSGGEKASYRLEVDLENPNPITQKSTDIVLEPNESLDTHFETFGVSGTNTALIEFSTLPPMDFSNRLNYLIRYPHGCVEQITSAVFPQIYLTDIFDLTFDKKKEVQKNVEAAIKKLNTYQSPNGGLAYWQGEREADEWSTNYVGHFMLEAKQKGYSLPLTFLSNWIRFQQNAARQWRVNARSYNTDIVQAYRLYTLALAGHPELAAMNRLRETETLGNDAKWRLAAAYALVGQKNVAREIAGTANILFQPKRYDYYTYGSPFRNKAMALETMVLLDDPSESDLALSIAKDLSSSKWLNTQETGFALMAMSKMADKNGGKSMELTYVQNGETTSIKTHQSIAQRELGFVVGKNKISIANKKDNRVYIQLVQEGILPMGDELEVKKNLSVTTVFLDGEEKPLSPKTLRQGTEITARITVENLSIDFIDNIALTQIFPSGWEIINTSFTELGGGASGDARYKDIRDDRVYFYFDLDGKKTKTFTVKLNASYLGRYYLPGTQVEAMYDHNFVARNKGQWIKVVQ